VLLVASVALSTLLQVAPPSGAQLAPPPASAPAVLAPSLPSSMPYHRPPRATGAGSRDNLLEVDPEAS